MNGAEATMLHLPLADQGRAMTSNDDSMSKTIGVRLLSMGRPPMLRLIARPAAGTIVLL